jgi:hypothetical protein
MQAIREIRDIDSQELVVKLPKEFLQKRAEIIILSMEEKDTDVDFHDIGAFEKELDALGWDMGPKLHTSREELYER